MEEYEEKIKKSAYSKTDEGKKPRNRISSGHFKKSNPIQTRHNDRDLPPNYLIGGENEVNLNHIEATKLKHKIIAEATRAYQENIGQKFQAKNYEWSLVVNLKPESTMQDLEKLSEHFFNKYGFQCYQIAIHRDEGHINEQGEKVINHHAHLEFITLDRQTGKNRSRDLWNNHKKMSQIQDEIAEILVMEREPYKKGKQKSKRIEPRQYAQMKEAEKRERKELEKELQTLKEREREIKQELQNIKKEKETILNEAKSKNNETLTKKQIAAYIELIRKQSIGKGYPKEFFNALSALKKGLIQKNKKLSLKEIQEEINKIFKPFDEMLKENKALKQEKEKQNKIIENQETKINALESDLKQEKEKNEELSKKTKENDLNAKESDLNSNSVLKELEQELDFIKNINPNNMNQNSYNGLEKLYNKYKSTLEKNTTIRNYDYLQKRFKEFPLNIAKEQRKENYKILRDQNLINDMKHLLNYLIKQEQEKQKKALEANKALKENENLQVKNNNTFPPFEKYRKPKKEKEQEQSKSENTLSI